jgi:outer membrane receptor protein involved in Fe transport
MTRSVPTLSAFLTLVAAGSAFSEYEGEGPLVLEEIVVTATKRAVGLQDLPMSLGVVTESQLRQINAVTLDDFWRLIPNLNVRDAPFGGNSVVIRGLADSDGFQSTESINAFYTDDTALTYVSGLFSTSADMAVLDLARVEVLRGPQGTLIGANAMGGAIRMITNDPDPEAPSRSFDLSLSNTNEGGWNYGGNIVLNQPTGENSAVRLAALYQDDDGFIDDVGLGRRDINSKQRGAGRISWLWNLSDSLDVLARVYAEDIETGDYNYADPIGRPWAGSLTDDDYQVVLYSPQPRDESLRLAAIRLRWRPQWGEFYSATSWFEKDLRLNYDFSWELYSNFGIDNPAPALADMDQRDLSQEFRLNSDGSGRFNWLAGLYMLDQKSDRKDVIRVPGLFGVALNIMEHLQRDDVSVFGEISWRFHDDLEAVAGGRWYRIDRDFFSSGFTLQGPFERRVAGDADDFVPKVSLSWEVRDETMLYGLASQGFRPGQFNGANAIELCGAREIIDSDELTNYEAGVKSRFGDGRVVLNATLFYIDWDDMQIDFFEQTCGFTYVENAGKASSRGLEVDFSWLASENFTLNGGFGYNKAQLEEGLTDPGIDAPAGTPIPNVPKWTANLSGNWGFQWVAGIRGEARADVQYVGSRNTSFAQSVDFPFPYVEELGSYALVNLRTSAVVDHWRVELFVNNVFDEMAEVGCCRPFWGPAVSRPRTIGIRGNWWFD